MSDQPGAYHFQVLFESALQDYERQTGITLANHPLAEQLQACHSADSVTALLQEQLLAFGEFREGDKIMGLLKNVVSALSQISATAGLGQNFGTVRPRPPMECSSSTDLDLFYSHFHLRMRYILASEYYSLYVPRFVR